MTKLLRDALRSATLTSASLLVVGAMNPSSALAQLPPGLSTGKPDVPHAPAPRPPPPLGPQPQIDQINALMRAQTDAIKALSSKVDALEERLSKIEAGRK